MALFSCAENDKVKNRKQGRSEKRADIPFIVLGGAPGSLFSLDPVNILLRYGNAGKEAISGKLEIALGMISGYASLIGPENMCVFPFNVFTIGSSAEESVQTAGCGAA